jgi:carbamoyl-phosphate synthase large subunit
MNCEIKVLVTGAGALLGQGVLRALKASSLKVRLIAVDPSPLAAGLYWADAAHLIPMAAAPDFLARIEEILSRERPDVVFIGTDVELAVFAEHRERLEREFATHIVVSSPEVIAIANDKWKTFEFFRRNGFACPESCLPGGEEELVKKVGFPLVVKPRVGARSVGVNLVRDWSELRAALHAGRNLILQECVGTPETEYTAGALYFDGRCDASIVMRRELRDGNTCRAFVEDYPELNRLVRMWTESLKPYGPVNFQFRVADGCAKVFEINGRFSGTTPLRALAGFNEVEMTLQRVLRGKPVSQPAVRPITILRYWSETVVESNALLGNSSGTVPTHAQERPVAGQGGGMHVLGTAQAQEWKDVLAQVAQYDFYHLPDYHCLAEERGEGTAHLFAYRDGDYTIALPLLLRPLEAGGGEPWNDATSVYGYAGPLASHADMPASVVRTFQAALMDALIERRVVAAFSRLHPLIAQGGILTGIGECRPAGQTVAIDLQQPLDAQWAQYRVTLKQRINKLRRNGVVCLLDENRRHLGEFVKIYHETMRRVDAHSSYFFDGDYFVRLARRLEPMLQLFVVIVGGRVTCGAVVTLCQGIVQYHLSGTGDDFQNLSTMHLLLDTVRLWANQRGARAFHLGGGVGAREDSLFEFKAGFSNCRHNFATWRWVVVPEVYAELCRERLRTDSAAGLEPVSADYFPAYRCPVRPRTEVAALAHHPASTTLTG